MMNKKLIILTFGMLLLSLTFVSASENKIWYGSNESNPSQMIPILLNNLGKLRMDLNLVNITAGILSLGGVPITEWGDIPDFFKLDGSTPMQGNANWGGFNLSNVSWINGFDNINGSGDIMTEGLITSGEVTIGDNGTSGISSTANLNLGAVTQITSTNIHYFNVGMRLTGATSIFNIAEVANDLVFNWSGSSGEYSFQDVNAEFEKNVTATWFKGLFNWTTGDDWNDFDGNTLNFNENRLNDTIDERSVNESEGNKTYWTQVGDQTGLSGDKSGDYNINTTGNLTGNDLRINEGSTYSIDLTLPAGKGLEIEGDDSTTGSGNSFRFLPAGGKDTFGGTFATGGNGGGVSLISGIGGQAGSGSFFNAGGRGGNFAMTSGIGGQVAGTEAQFQNTGGAGGSFAFIASQGGVSAPTGSSYAHVGGVGGSFAISAGVGGTALFGSSQTGGAGGNIGISSGNGGSAATQTGAGGDITLTSANGDPKGDIIFQNSISEVARFVGNTGLRFWDGKSATFGDSDDMEVVHNGGAGFVQNNKGSLNLYSPFQWNFGALTADTDLRLGFVGTSNTGLYFWMEDEDYFLFDDDVRINSTERLYFNNERTFMYDDGNNSIINTTNGSLHIKNQTGWGIIEAHDFVVHTHNATQDDALESFIEGTEIFKVTEQIKDESRPVEVEYLEEKCFWNYIEYCENVKTCEMVLNGEYYQEKCIIDEVCKEEKEKELVNDYSYEPIRNETTGEIILNVTTQKPMGYNRIEVSYYQTLPQVCENVTKIKIDYPYTINSTGESQGQLLANLKETAEDLNKNIDLYDNLTDFDTGITVEDIYTQSKVIDLVTNYALKFLNITNLISKDTHKNKVILPELPEGKREVLSVEDRIVDLEGAFSDHMFCMFNNPKYSDYRDCMLDINPKDKLK